ncbi:AEC family transporter [Halioxenophilus sp. WMMB6]|uniref:AEC family transporter n=1 Tax=Halioxenophilus sp. WMMB6 TaxID=3073815 RepID=UPI00295EFA70|nr:AEC family transporter [Halioxenophilus sp. WMMB6]
MLSILALILPIFALILCGWLVRRVGWVKDAAAAELNRFVVLLALPALLFDIVAEAEWASLWQPDFILCYTLATFAIFVATIVVQRRRRRALADAAVDGLNTSYSNTGYMGFPLLLAVFGSDSQQPVMIATLITVCLLFAVGITLIEAGLQSQRAGGQLALMVVKKVLSNPIVAAPLLALVIPVFNWSLPQPVAASLKLLGDSAAPCALVTIGLFLGGRAGGRGLLSATSGVMVATKLIVHPLLTYLLAVYVFHLPDYAMQCAVLVAALPTGTGPFMAAEYYRRETAVTSNAILISTLLSPISLTLILAWFAAA